MPPDDGHTDVVTSRRRGERVAAVALAVVAILFPLVALAGAIVTVPWAGALPTADQLQRQYAWLVAGAVGSGLGVAAAIGVLTWSRYRPSGASVAAKLALAVALITGVALSLTAISAYPQLVKTQTNADAPACGSESPPVIFGGDSRYTPCPDDVAISQAFLNKVVDYLPLTDVSKASVDEKATVLDDQDGPPSVYQGSIELAQGVIVAAWMLEPVTCATLTWQNDKWTGDVQGELADGGCIYTGGG